jgi:hypothetical protein
MKLRVMGLLQDDTARQEQHGSIVSVLSVHQVDTQYRTAAYGTAIQCGAVTGWVTSTLRGAATARIKMRDCETQRAYTCIHTLTTLIFFVGEKCYTQTHSPHINGIAYRDCTG